MSKSLGPFRPLATASTATGAHAAFPPVLLQALAAWAALGLLALLLVPAARGHSQLIGWMPFWCVLAPLSCLLVAGRMPLKAALSAFLVGRQRRRPRRGQARRLLQVAPVAAMPRRVSRRSPAACAPSAARTPR